MTNEDKKPADEMKDVSAGIDAPAGVQTPEVRDLPDVVPDNLKDVAAGIDRPHVAQSPEAQGIADDRRDVIEG